MVEKECEHCGKKFNAKRNNQKFCSKECREGLIICAECGKEHKRHYKNFDGDYICSSCYHKKYKPNIPLVICAECGREHKRNSKNPNGEYICKSCYDKKYRPDTPLITCAECGKEYERRYKNFDGNYVCGSCYHKKYRHILLVICAECGKEHERGHKNSDGNYICNSCYHKKYRHIPLVICAECGREHKRNSKNPNGEYICQSCYNKKYKPDVPLVKCTECGKEHERGHKNSDGNYICQSCYYKRYRLDIPLIICAECGREHKRNHKNLNGDYICGSCYIVSKCKEIIVKNMQYYNFEDEDDVNLFISDMKKKYPHARMYRQLECELLGYGNYNEAMDQALIRDNYTCQITGKKGNVVVHHLNSYNTHKELGCDLDNLITLNVDFHKLYHNICGRGNNTAEQFWKFVEEYKYLHSKKD